jgi:hypothetical protein
MFTDRLNEERAMAEKLEGDIRTMNENLTKGQQMLTNLQVKHAQAIYAVKLLEELSKDE